MHAYIHTCIYNIYMFVYIIHTYIIHAYMLHDPSEKDVWLAEVGTGVSRVSTSLGKQAGMVLG